MPQFIGVDIGGTNIRAALTDSSCQVAHRLQRPADASRPPEQYLKDIQDLLRELQSASDAPVAAIGLGIPGIIDVSSGIVHQSPHFPEWKDFKIREALQQLFDCELFIDNDANCAAFGEFHFGAGQGNNNGLCLTLGTGIGGGIIVDGELYRGERGFAAELGHIVVEAEGAACHCGGQGCLEMYASATGLKNLQVSAPMSADELAQAASSGDEAALKIWNQFGYYLGLGVASIVNVLGLHTVIIGGGVSAAWDFFHDAMQTEFARRSYKETTRMTRIQRSQLGDDAGLMGAAYGAATRLSRIDS